MNSFIKNLIRAKDNVYKKFVRKSNNMYHLCAFNNLQNHLNQSIQIAKQNYVKKIAERLGDPNTSSKFYWLLLKTLLNGKKIPCIPPLFHGDKCIVDFQEKSEIFNSFFADQCSPISNGSVLPSELPLRTDSSLPSCHFTKDDILRIINNLDPNKAHGHDEISIRMLKICGDSTCRPLSIIFKTCLRTGIFPLEWKKANIAPIHKRGDKQTVLNYRPVSLLPICGKIFERLLYTEMLNFFLQNDLISPKQSGFRPGDSCINQQLSINHEILSSFDIGLEVRGLFLDISKAFDKVWHAGLIYKLRQNGICGDLINILNDFLTNRKQRVVLNGQCSSWVDIRAGVPKGSILGPLLFLIYVIDLPNGLKSECKLFADYTSLFSVTHDLNTSASDINNDLKLISDWAFQWKMSFNPDPSKQAQEIIFSRKKMKSSHPSVYFNNIPVNSTSVHKHLGMLLADMLSYKHHQEDNRPTS